MPAEATYAPACAAEETQTGTPLSRREREILRLIADGLSSQKVAERLYISKRTVDFHLYNIYHKLDVSNRIQLLREVDRRRLLG